MNTPTFVLSASTVRAPLRKSAVLGRSVANRVSVVQNRRTHLLVFACIPSDQPTEDQTESAGQAPPVVESTTTTPGTSAEDTSTESSVEESTVGEVVATAHESVVSDQESTVEEIVVNADESVTDQESNVEEVVPKADESVSDQESTVQEVVAQTDESATDQEENVVEVAPKSEESVTDQVDQSSPQDLKGEGQKKRRRRSRKRDITLPLEKMSVGMELDGVVKSVTNYGAFVGDMGTPTDGLLHVSQLGAGYVENVTDVVKVGEKLKVRVLSIDIEKGNFSLTRKTAEELQADSEPKANRKEAAAAKKEELNRKWSEFTFDPEVFVDARVMSVTDFGGFCQLIDENGEPLASCPTDGLIHISELSNERVSKVSDIISEGQIVKVRITSTDRKRNRISMSLRPVPEAGANEDGAPSFSADMEMAEKNQPTFKTSFELAFETARTAANKE